MSDARLKSLAERIERLMDERDGIQGDIRDIYSEAKSAGYVPKVLRKAITRKRMDASKRDEEDAILDLYEGALSGPMRRAVQMAASGKTSREIEDATGIDHATVARSVALNKKSATKSEEQGGRQNSLRDGEASADERDASASSSPPESCGGGLKGPDSSAKPGALETPPRPAGVAPGPQDLDLTLPPFLDRRAAA